MTIYGLLIDNNGSFGVFLMFLMLLLLPGVYELKYFNSGCFRMKGVKIRITLQQLKNATTG